MSIESEIEDAFPELASIEDEGLRRSVVRVWVDAMVESDYESLTAVPWWPPLAAEMGDPAPSITTAEHVRDVTALATSMADVLAESVGVDVDRDVVLAGALLHDVSKLYELSGDETTEYNDFVPHPHAGVHLLAREGLSAHLQHVVLAHSKQSAVQPRTLEATVVAAADRLAVAALFWEYTGRPGPGE